MTSTLVTVASKGDLTTLQGALAGDYEDFSEDDLNEALLRTACLGYVDCLTSLLVHGADPDYEDLDGDTPLMLAASNNHVEVARRLLRRGCDVDARSDRNRTALHMAVWNNRPRIIRLLLRARCNLNVRDRYGDTPLMLSARRGHADIMQMLLDAGSDVNKTSNEKETALHYAARQGHKACVQLLLKGSDADVNARSVWGLTPLMHAASSRCAEAALDLVSHGADVTSQDLADRSVLHYAVKNDMRALAQRLLELGADSNVTDSDGNTPLFDALIAKRHPMVALLVTFGCRVRDVIGHVTVSGDYRWYTALEAAVLLGLTSTARLLYATGCNWAQFVVPVDRAAISADMTEWVAHSVGQPRPLAHIVRIAIRDLLGDRLQQKLNTLSLPPAFVTFLSFANDREFNE